jgi:nicotinamidase-related amidase
LVIDLQNDTCSPKGILASKGKDISAVRKIIPNVKLVLEEARRLDLLIIFMKSLRSKDGICEPGPRHRLWEKFKAFPDPETVTLVEGTWGSEVVDDLKPRPDERQLAKYQSDSFLGTPLELILKNKGIKSVVVVGVGTWGCVEATVRTLNYTGYYPVVVSDGVSDPQRDLHDASLRLMSASFADVVSSKELINIWRSACAGKV